MKRSRKSNKKKIDNTNMMLVFKNVPFELEFDEEAELSDEEKDKIRWMLSLISKEINIDKSYVDFEGNLHLDTFLEEEGWNDLCNMIYDTDFGNTASEKQSDIMTDAYMLILVTYAYSMFELYGYDIEQFNIELKKNTAFRIEFYKDNVQAWKYYPGPWQDWKNN